MKSERRYKAQGRMTRSFETGKFSRITLQFHGKPFIIPLKILPRLLNTEAFSNPLKLLHLRNFSYFLDYFLIIVIFYI